MQKHFWPSRNVPLAQSVVRWPISSYDAASEILERSKGNHQEGGLRTCINLSFSVRYRVCLYASQGSTLRWSDYAWLNKQNLKSKPHLFSSDYINRAENKTRSVSNVHFNMLEWGAKFRQPDAKAWCWASNAWQEILDDPPETSQNSRRCRYSWQGTTASTMRLDWPPHQGGDNGTTRYKLSMRVRGLMGWRQLRKVSRNCLIHVRF